MENFTVNFLNKKIHFGINKMKLFMGSNFTIKFEMIQALRSHFYKSNTTEYNQRFDRKSLYVNDKIADIRHWEYYEISPHYDLQSEMKLGTKSLILRYFEALLKEVEYGETLFTLNLLIKRVEEEYLESDSIFDDELSLKGIIQEHTLKAILKQVQPLLMIEGLDANVYDLSYYDILILQLKLLNQIADRNKDKSFVCCLFLSDLNGDFLQKICDLIQSNMYCIIIAEGLLDEIDMENININDIAICEKKVTDLSNEEHLYENVIMDFPSHMDLVELKKRIMNSYIVNTDKSDKIRQYL